MSRVSYDFSGSRVLITGATSGIGRATAEAFLKAGASVMLSGLRQDDTGELMQKLASDASGRVFFEEFDVSDESQVSALVEQAVAVLGGIDIVVNNAGTEGYFGPLHTMSSAEYDRLMGINLRGMWLSLKYEIPHLGKGAVIINTASTAGIQSIPMITSYSATKHGIIGLTKGVALELAEQGIRVNAVAPGAVDTGLLHRMVDGQVPLEVIADSVPLKRIAQPAEIASAILWLASEGSSYVTGETLIVDGGVTQT